MNTAKTVRLIAGIAAFALANLAQATPIVTIYVDDDAIWGEVGDTNEMVITNLNDDTTFNDSDASWVSAAVLYDNLILDFFAQATEANSDKLNETFATISGTGDAYITVVATGFSQGTTATAVASVGPEDVTNGAELDYTAIVDGQTVLVVDDAVEGVSEAASLVIDPLSDPYTIVQQAFVSLSTANDKVTFDAVTTVPAPGVLPILGLLLVTGGLISRRGRRIR